MRGLRILVYRLGGLFQRSRRDHELDEEIESNLQLQISDNIAAGMSADDARRQALIKLGGIDQTKEAYREQRGLPLLDSLSQDLSYAARVLRKSPGYTSVAVLTLALGIGANAAIFSIVYGVLLQPLPYKDPGRLVVVNETKKGPGWSGFAMLGVSPPDFHAFRERNRSFEKVAAYSPGSMVVRIGQQSERVDSLQATHELFSVLGREPMLGRSFRADEEIAGNNHVVVISWRLWQKEFAGNGSALGRTLTLDRQMPSTVDTEKYVVIGIMPPSFDFPVDSETDLWMPLTVSSDPNLQGATYLPMIGRLKPGVSTAQAEADLQSIANGQKPYQWMVVLDQLADNVVSKVRPSLWMLFGAVVFVLLIAAANMASLALSRVSAPERGCSPISVGRGPMATCTRAADRVHAAGYAGLDRRPADRAPRHDGDAQHRALNSAATGQCPSQSSRFGIYVFGRCRYRTLARRRPGLARRPNGPAASDEGRQSDAHRPPAATDRHGWLRSCTGCGSAGGSGPDDPHHGQAPVGRFGIRPASHPHCRDFTAAGQLLHRYAAIGVFR